jgi:hypothetical protein
MPTLIPAEVGPGEELVRTVLTAVSVLATVAAVLLALFLQWWRVEKRRPVLRLTFSDDLKKEDLAPLDFEDRLELWVRLKVRARPKKATARNVEVLLLRVHRPPNAEYLGLVPSRQLAWADTPNERPSIPAGTWRRVDVLKLVARLDGAGPPVLAPALKEYDDVAGPQASRYSGERYHLTDEGDYAFDLALTADEMESTWWHLTFSYTSPSETVLKDNQVKAKAREQLVPRITNIHVDPQENPFQEDEST